jgi:thioredoxin-related protein
MTMKPIVDGIEREFEGRLKVIRLNIQEPVGQLLGRQFHFEFTPTFILFDVAGKELWRTVGAIDPKEVRRSISEP